MIVVQKVKWCSTFGMKETAYSAFIGYKTSPRQKIYQLIFLQLQDWYRRMYGTPEIRLERLDGYSLGIRMGMEVQTNVKGDKFAKKMKVQQDRDLKVEAGQSTKAYLYVLGSFHTLK